MADLSREGIIKLAQLARLELTEEEIDSFSSELTAILGYVEKLHSVDVDDLKPTQQVTGLVNVSRKDVIKDYGYTPKELLANVPHVKDDLIKVKRIIA